MGYQVTEVNTTKGLKSDILVSFTIVCKDYYTFYKDPANVSPDVALKKLRGSGVEVVSIRGTHRHQGLKLQRKQGIYLVFGVINNETGVSALRSFEHARRPFAPVLKEVQSAARVGNDLEITYNLRFYIVDWKAYVKAVEEVLQQAASAVGRVRMCVVRGGVSRVGAPTMTDGVNAAIPCHLAPVGEFAAVQCVFELGDYMKVVSIPFPFFQTPGKMPPKLAGSRFECSPPSMTLGDVKSIAWEASKEAASVCNLDGWLSTVLSVASRTGDIFGPAVSAFDVAITKNENAGRVLATLTTKPDSVIKFSGMGSEALKWVEPAVIFGELMFGLIADPFDSATDEPSIERAIREAGSAIDALPTLSQRVVASATMTATALRALILYDIDCVEQETRGSRKVQRAAIKTLGWAIKGATAGVLLGLIGAVELGTAGLASFAVVVILPSAYAVQVVVDSGFKEMIGRIDSIPFSAITKKNTTSMDAIAMSANGTLSGVYQVRHLWSRLQRKDSSLNDGAILLWQKHALHTISGLEQLQPKLDSAFRSYSATYE